MRWVGHVAYMKGHENCITNSDWKTLEPNQGEVRGQN
jgi:hypothetical protein